MLSGGKLVTLRNASPNFPRQNTMPCPTGGFDVVSSLSGTRQSLEIWRCAYGTAHDNKRFLAWRLKCNSSPSSITDLTTFESVPHEEWAEKEDLFEIGNRFARAMLAANPNFRHRGMCVAIYDEAGIAASVMPLDTLQ
jgi:hypothetical protein